MGDRDSFVTARTLARDEGILAGGSSGMVLFASQRVCKSLKQGLVVAILPDSGKSYLSKMYNDDWMRENGFLPADGRHGSIADVLKAKKGAKMVTISPSDTVKTAITLMKTKDISQMPVYDGKKVLGKVTERQLLTGLYMKSIGPSNHIRAVLDPNIITVSESESVDQVSRLLEEENLVVVVNKTAKPIGVVTRIDLIDYYT